jgi:DnaJ-class molecular chaperone
VRDITFSLSYNVQDASAADIRKAYRKLTLQLHPDKNKAEDAEEKFRQVGYCFF